MSSDGSTDGGPGDGLSPLGLVPSGAYVIHTLIGNDIAYLGEFFQLIDGTDSRWVLSGQDAGAGLIGDNDPHLPRPNTILLGR